MINLRLLHSPCLTPNLSAGALGALALLLGLFWTPGTTLAEEPQAGLAEKSCAATPQQ